MDEQSIFIRALATPTTEERIALLDELCGQDAGLRTRIDLLLETHERETSLLDNSAEVELGQTKFEEDRNPHDKLPSSTADLTQAESSEFLGVQPSVLGKICEFGEASRVQLRGRFDGSGYRILQTDSPEMSGQESASRYVVAGASDQG